MIEHRCTICGTKQAKHTLSVCYHGSEYGIPCYWKVLCDDCLTSTEGWHRLSNNRMCFVQLLWVPRHGTSEEARFDVCVHECDKCGIEFYKGSMQWTEDGNFIYCPNCLD